MPRLSSHRTAIRRFRPRYTLRGLAVSVLVAAMVMGWVANERRQLEEERREMMQLKKELQAKLAVSAKGE